MIQKFEIEGMTCSGCSATVKRVVEKLDGINNVDVNLEENCMTVDFNEQKLGHGDIIKAVYNAGFDAKLD